MKGDLGEKSAIAQDAIDLALTMGIRRPRVAILAAVEAVSDRFSSTTDAAALCKMSERGQITGGILDGPLGLEVADPGRVPDHHASNTP